MVELDLSLFPGVLSAVAILGIRKKEWWGPLVAIFASAVWIMYGYATGQWGICLSESIFAVLYAITVVEWLEAGS